VGAELSGLSAQGIDLAGANPAVIGQALELGTATREGSTKLLFANIADIIKQQESDLQERQRKDLEFASSIMGIVSKTPSVLSVMSGEDLESLKSGVVSTELLQKIGAAAATDAGEGFTLSEGQARFDAQGNVIASIAPKKSTSGLDTQTATRVNQIVNNFDNEAVVKNYSIIAEANEFVSNLKNKEVTSSDDQGLLYAFAKAMDPGSVVREGEYAVVQKYAQSWAQQFGFKTKRIFENSPFLSESARENMRETIKAKYNASLKNYDSVYSEYGRRIDKATGAADGKEYLTDYSLSFKKDGEGEQSGGEYYREYSQNGRDYVQEGNTLYLVNPDETLMEVGQAEIPKDGGVSAATEVERVADAIGEFESEGDYSAKGPVVKSGAYKGDRAIGKYQVMGKNVPSWTKEALGFAMTADEFAESPEAQDAVAEYRMGKLLAQGYGLEDVASIWFTGSPLAQGSGKKDDLGTTGDEYVKKVRAIYERNA
jgi:hypothetical protein